VPQADYRRNPLLPRALSAFEALQIGFVFQFTPKGITLAVLSHSCFGSFDVAQDRLRASYFGFAAEGGAVRILPSPRRQ
jgi:hypothetical protein